MKIMSYSYNWVVCVYGKGTKVKKDQNEQTLRGLVYITEDGPNILMWGKLKLRWSKSKQHKKS